MPPKKWVPFHDPSKRWCICQVGFTLMLPKFLGPFVVNVNMNVTTCGSCLIHNDVHLKTPTIPSKTYLSLCFKGYPSQWKCSQREAKKLACSDLKLVMNHRYWGDLASFMVRFLAQISYLQRIQTYETLFGVGLSSPKPVTTHLVQTRHQWSTPTVRYFCSRLLTGSPSAQKKIQREGVGGVNFDLDLNVPKSPGPHFVDGHIKTLHVPGPKLCQWLSSQIAFRNPFSRGGKLQISLM